MKDLETYFVQLTCDPAPADGAVMFFTSSGFGDGSHPG